MNGPRPPLPVRVAEGWVAFYTRGLPREVRDARRDELRSDLWEHLQHASSDRRWSIQVIGRVVRGMADDLWWRFEQRAAGRPQPEAAARRRDLLAWLFDWVVSPAIAIGVLLTAWLSTSPFRLMGALVGLFVALAVLRMKLVGPVKNESALMFGVVVLADADPGRLRRLWGGLLASVLLLVGIKAYAATLNPLRDMASAIYLAESLASIGILVTVLMLLNEYARRWRRQRRGRSGE